MGVAFADAVDSADTLEQLSIVDPAASSSSAEIDALTEQLRAETEAVNSVTKQLADASELFMESRRAVWIGNLNEQIARAQEVLTSEGASADAQLVANLEAALQDAQDLAADEAAHPNDLKLSMQNLSTLTSEVEASAGPKVEDLNGSWVPTNAQDTGALPLNITYPALNADTTLAVEVASDGTLQGTTSFPFGPSQQNMSREIALYPAGVPMRAEHVQAIQNGCVGVPGLSQVISDAQDTSRDRIYRMGTLQQACTIWLRQ